MQESRQSPKSERGNTHRENGCGGPTQTRSLRETPPWLAPRTSRLRRHVPEFHAVHVDRTRDVLDLLRAEVLEGEAQLVQHLIAHGPADADPAGFGQRLEAR